MRSGWVCCAMRRFRLDEEVCEVRVFLRER